jgi:hypothetical protein
VLSRTTSCDDGVRVDLTCDGCGASFSTTVRLHQDPAALWRAASERGWALLPNGCSSGHRCGDCPPSPALPGVHAGDCR